MPDIIQLPKLSATIDGSSYPITALEVQATLGELLEFSITFTSGDAKDGGILTISMIRHLAEKVQKMIYKEPKKSNVKAEALGYKGETLSVEGVAIGVNLTATSTGGLACTVSALGNDALLGQVNYNIWMAYVDTKSVIEQLAKRNNGYTNKVYVAEMDLAKQESTGDPLTRRVKDLIITADQYQEDLNKLNLEALQNPVLEKQYKEICKFNDSMYEDVMKFLIRSNKYTKMFNGEATINKETAKNIICGIHEMLFESGDNFFDAMMSIAATFKMWYVPKLAEKGTGYLMNQKYGDEETDGEVSIYCDYVNTAHQGGAYSMPPCKYFTITGNTIETVQDKLVRPPTAISGTYPKEPKRKFGVGYVAGAPGWLISPVVYQEDSKSVSPTTLEKAKKQEGEKPNRSEQKEAADNTKEKNKKNLDSQVSILEYLAKKSYYWTLMQPSVAVISGPFNGRPHCEVGDMVTFGANPGGKIGKGIVTGIGISLTPSHSSVSINLNAVTLGDNEIE